jgi:hypothetical protein
MLRMKFVLVAGLAAFFAALSFTPALAQTAPGAPHAPRIVRPRPRIEITPRPLLYRRCVDWLELQYRPSGTVLYPQYRCWWVRG